ncbi:hypothetical protein ABIC02_006340 [Bradyrhizobium sp. RT5a]
MVGNLGNLGNLGGLLPPSIQRVPSGSRWIEAVRVFTRRGHD